MHIGCGKRHLDTRRIAIDQLDLKLPEGLTSSDGLAALGILMLVTCKGDSRMTGGRWAMFLK